MAGCLSSISGNRTASPPLSFSCPVPALRNVQYGKVMRREYDPDAVRHYEQCMAELEAVERLEEDEGYWERKLECLPARGMSTRFLPNTSI